MQIKTLVLAFFVSAALSAPAPAKDAKQANCPNGWTSCGKCNGTSCKVGGINYSCKQGTSCVGNGGGDGAACGARYIWGLPGSNNECPVTV